MIKIGIDNSNIQRFSKMINEKNISLINRIFTPNEQIEFEKISDTTRVAERMAGKFCAKEAFAKALGIGIAEGVSWLDMEVLPDSKGAPVFTVKGKTSQIFSKLKFTIIEVSISHDGGQAVSIVLIQ